MKTTTSLIAAAVFATVLTGCAPGMGSASYSREQARREHTVRMGYVESVRDVRIDGTRSGAGVAGGAVAGGVAGSAIGRGRGSALGAIGGAVLGGIAGHAAEQHFTTKPGVELTVKLDNGQLIAIVQEADEAFRPGDRVRVLSDGATSRVTR